MEPTTKKAAVLIFLLLFSIGSLATVYAQAEAITSAYGDTVWGRFLSKIDYTLRQQGSFTVAGDELQCDKYPTEITKMKKGETVTFPTSSQSTGFINVFRGSPNDGAYSDHPGDSRQFLGEYFVQKLATKSWACDAGAYWNEECYVDYYFCKNPCYSNSDCPSGQQCVKDVLSNYIANAGVCKVANPTHTTKVYECSTGKVISTGTATYGTRNFCNDPTDSKYLIQSASGVIDQCLPYTPSPCTTAPVTTTPSTTQPSDSTTSGGDSGNAATVPVVIESTPNVIISNIQISSLKVSPGDTVDVTFDVKSLDDLSGVKTREYYIEAGIIPRSTATLWGITKSSGAFSILDFFKGDRIKNECCDGQPNIQGGTYIFGGLPSPSETISSTFDESRKTIRVKLNAPNSQTKDLCPVNGGSTYWDSSSKDYVLYMTVKNGCFKDGYRRGVFEAKELTLDVSTNTTGRSDGEKCEKDYECKSGTCSGFLTKTCKTSASQPSGSTASGENKLIDFKKVSLTRDKISKATSEELLASSCKTSAECVASSNYTAECVSISRLREDGVLTKSAEDNYFDHAGKLVKGSFYGGTAGVATCVVLSSTIGLAGLGPGALLASPAILGGCAAFGAAIGGSATQIALDITDDDNLVKSLKAKDANAVGICTAEKGAFDLGRFIEKVGAAIKITGNKNTDGLITLVGGVVLLVFILGSLGGRK